MHGDAHSCCRLLCVTCFSATPAQVLALVGAPEYDIVGFPTAKLEDLEKLRYDAKRSIGSYYALDAIVNHQPESPEAIRTHAQQTLAKLKSKGFGPTLPNIPLPAFYSNVFAKMTSTVSASTALGARVEAAAK
jgi:hypothetical protein